MVTREQLAAFLYRYARINGYDISASADISGFTDRESVSEYAAAAMRWAVGAKIIYGTSNTTLSPKAGATRGQIAAMIYRFARYYGLDTAMDAAVSSEA